MRVIVKRAFSGGDDWRASVRAEMQWPSNVDEEILSSWASFQKAARAEGSEPDPVAFAHAFADEFSKD